MPDRAVDRFAWTRLVRRTRGLSPQAKVLADALAFDFYNRETGQLNPGIDALAIAIGASRSTVKRAVGELQAFGFLEAETARGRGRTNRYEMVIPGEVATHSDARKRSNGEPIKNGSDPIRKRFKGEPSIGTHSEQKEARASKRAEVQTILVPAKPDVIDRWSTWLRAQGLDAEKLVQLTRGDQIELPASLPPDAGHYTERRSREWFADRFAAIPADRRCSA